MKIHGWCSNHSMEMIIKFKLPSRFILQSSPRDCCLTITICRKRCVLRGSSSCLRALPTFESLSQGCMMFVFWFFFFLLIVSYPANHRASEASNHCNLPLIFFLCHTFTFSCLCNAYLSVLSDPLCSLHGHRMVWFQQTVFSLNPINVASVLIMLSSNILNSFCVFHTL